MPVPFILALLLLITLIILIIFEYKNNIWSVLVFKTTSSLLFVLISVSCYITKHAEQVCLSYYCWTDFFLVW